MERSHDLTVKAFNTLFLTELLERYGFYVIQTLLIFYLTQAFHLNDALSYGVLGSITALAYGNSVIGGYIADRLLGHRLAVWLATLLLTLGYGCVTWSGSLPLTLWAFAFIALGTGLLKPNTSSMVGFLYKGPGSSERRQSAYTVYFVGVNIGTMAGSTLGGYIQKYVSWHGTFLSATFALALAGGIFCVGMRYVKQFDQPMWGKGTERWLPASLLMIAALVVGHYVIVYQHLASLFFAVVAILSMLTVLVAAYREKGVMRRRFIAFLIMLGFSVFFYIMYFQMFFSMNLFVDRVVDLNWAGIRLVPAVFPPIEALTIVLLGPFVARFWLRCKRINPVLSPSIPMKFAIGLCLQALALGIYYLHSLQLTTTGFVTPGPLVFAYVSMGAGELLIMPVALALISELLPERTCGLMMGIFFIALGVAGKLAGALANITDIPIEKLQDIVFMQHVYQHGFKLYFILCLAIGALALSLTPYLKRLLAV